MAIKVALVGNNIRKDGKLAPRRGVPSSSLGYLIFYNPLSSMELFVAQYVDRLPKLATVAL